MTTYSEAVEQTITAGEQIHQIVNGTATTEVTVEDGSKVPSIRKALLDNFYFKDPIAWQVGQTENVFNQLRQFTDGSWWYAPSATASNPISMGSTPVGNPLWKIYDFDAIGKLTPQLREALRRSYAESGYNVVGTFQAGFTIVNANDVGIDETTGKGYTGPAGPVAPGTNPASGGFVDKSGGLLRHELSNVEERLLGVGAKIYRGSNGQYVQNGDTVPAGTTHLAVLINGKPENVSMSPVASGLVADLTETSATIGGVDIAFSGVANGFLVMSTGSTTPRRLDDRLADVANVKDYGAVGDGVSDDTVAIQNAFNDGVYLFPKGVFRVTDTLFLNDGYNIKGAGSVHPRDLSNDSLDRTVIKADHSKSSIIETVAAGGGQKYALRSSSVKDVVIASTTPVADQNAFVMSRSPMLLSFDNVNFKDITGYCFYFKRDSYAENMSIENCGAWEVAGVFGTEAPAPLDRFISMNLLSITNWALGGTLNANTSITTLWDFRSVSMVTVNTFLNQGNGNGICTEIMRFGYGGRKSFTGLWSEWSSLEPLNLMSVEGEDDRYYASLPGSISFSQLSGIGSSYGRINIESGCDSIICFDYLGAYTVAVTDTVIFADPPSANRKALVKFNNLESKYLQVTNTDDPRIEVTNNTYINPTNGFEIVNTTPLVKWRGANGDPEVFSSVYGRFTTYKDTSEMVNDGNIRALRLTRSGSFTSRLRFSLVMPSDLYNNYITVAVRCKVVATATDCLYRLAAFNDVTSNGNRRINDIVPGDDYKTYYMTTKVTGNNVVIDLGRYTGGNGDTELYMASYDIFLGTKPINPLDLSPAE